jgi:hypothetical protein
MFHGKRRQRGAQQSDVAPAEHNHADVELGSLANGEQEFQQLIAKSVSAATATASAEILASVKLLLDSKHTSPLSPKYTLPGSAEAWPAKGQDMTRPSSAYPGVWNKGRMPGPWGTGIRQHMRATTTSVEQVKQQVEMHIILPALIAGFSFSAMMALKDTTRYSSQVFLMTSSMSTLLNFMAVFMFVYIGICLPTPGCERHFRLFDDDIDIACLMFTFGSQFFVASVGIRAYDVTDGDGIGTGLLIGSMAMTVLLNLWISCKFAPRITEAWISFMDLANAPDDLPAFLGMSYGFIKSMPRYLNVPVYLCMACGGCIPGILVLCHGSA